eukprot:TRINITY_DN9666_c0_g1_i1.p1 TRINITY_DN9666_c0_g1~~TRINITY_DN9666_c0_g1_i1.p1  ORF type:complete len:312 (+),score=85.45 TRINITY_DN9666_c0_g1_i1:116-1051(+)
MTDILVRQITDSDLSECDELTDLAFGTFIGIPKGAFLGDSSYFRFRHETGIAHAFVAESDGKIVGAIGISVWGSFAYVGPLVVHPTHWNKGVGQKLLAATQKYYDENGIKRWALFTFCNSYKHHKLYTRFGYRPMFLTYVNSKTIAPGTGSTDQTPLRILDNFEWEIRRQQFTRLTNSVLDGFDVSREIEAALQKKELATVLFTMGSSGEVAAFAVVHHGPGSEAGSTKLYVKFAAASNADSFGAIVEAAETCARRKGFTTVEAGSNLARTEAHDLLLSKGFEPKIIGVACQSHNDHLYNRPGRFIIDDWR